MSLTAEQVLVKLNEKRKKNALISIKSNGRHKSTMLKAEKQFFEFHHKNFAKTAFLFELNDSLRFTNKKRNSWNIFCPESDSFDDIADEINTMPKLSFNPYSALLSRKHGS